MIAAMNGHTHTVRVLLEHGADIDAKNNVSDLFTFIYLIYIVIAIIHDSLYTIHSQFEYVVDLMYFV